MAEVRSAGLDVTFQFFTVFKMAGVAVQKICGFVCSIHRASLVL